MNAQRGDIGVFGKMEAVGVAFGTYLNPYHHKAHAIHDWDYFCKTGKDGFAKIAIWYSSRSSINTRLQLSEVL